MRDVKAEAVVRRLWSLRKERVVGMRRAGRTRDVAVKMRMALAMAAGGLLDCVCGAKRETVG